MRNSVGAEAMERERGGGANAGTSQYIIRIHALRLGCSRACPPGARVLDGPAPMAAPPPARRLRGCALRGAHGELRGGAPAAIRVRRRDLLVARRHRDGVREWLR